MWNGTFSCVAGNVAGQVKANYSLMVIRTGEVGRILDLKLEYFVILTVTVRTNQNTASGHVTQYSPLIG